MTYKPITVSVRGIYTDRVQHILGGSREQIRAEFDAWLNEELAKAWTEGFDRGFYRGQILHGDYDASEAGIENPYEVG